MTPACSVYSYCSGNVDYQVRLSIGSLYDETVTVTGHAPATRRLVTFPNWTPQQVGTYAVKCSTIYAADTDSSNDFRSGQSIVTVTDVGVEAISRPLEITIPGSTPVTARVRNYGSVRAENIRFSVRIVALGGGQVYADSADIAGLDPGSALNASFRSWNAPVGLYTMTARATVAGDLNPANDSMLRSIAVGDVDLGVTQILEPEGRLETLTVITPAAMVRNYGNVAVSGRAFFTIAPEGRPRVYYDSSPKQSVGVGSEVRFEVGEWPFPHPSGRYTVRCSVGVMGDGALSNNVRQTLFLISAMVVPPGWVQKADVPVGPRSKNVKDGGCLAGYTSGLDAFVYGLKGNSQYEFYRYDAANNAWTTLESMPAIGSIGKKKGVKKGASLATPRTTRGKVYATKGGKTTEFWQYDPAGRGYKWTQLADVPAGAMAIKEGSGQAFVQLGDSGFIYLLKGSGTTEFYRYDTSANVWASLAGAPVGVSGKPFKNGSCICYDGAGTIYCLKGSFGEFYSYSIAANSWTTLAILPKTGSAGKKKVKDGAGIAWYDGCVYALKGGNTLEFWRFDGMNWAELAGVPLGGGKNVKGGGALTATEDALYALKGNKTLEFYQYGPGAMVLAPAVRTDRADALGRPAGGLLDCALMVAPNPVSGSASISYSAPGTGPVCLRLYDVSGKLVRTLRDGHAPAGPATYDLRPASLPGLARGVYVLELEMRDPQLGTSVQSRKVIIE